MNKTWLLPLKSSQRMLGDGQTGMWIGISTQGETCASTGCGSKRREPEAVRSRAFWAGKSLPDEGAA